MSDIIKDAKKALEGTTPGPWVTGGKDESGNIYIGNPSEYGNLVATSGICDADLIAAARDFAQALAEETWEYSYHVQNTIGMWEHPTTQPGDPEKWWETKEEAEESALAAHEYGYPIRIVGRRVSPPEVIDE